MNLRQHDTIKPGFKKALAELMKEYNVDAIEVETDWCMGGNRVMGFEAYDSYGNYEVLSNKEHITLELLNES